MGKKHSARVTTRQANQRRSKRVTFRQQLLKSLPVILSAVALTLFFSRAGYLRELETSALDTVMRLKSVPEGERKIVIVRISDQDYRQLFNEKSPLDPEKLSTLIAAIACGQPKVIGIDIETSDLSFKDMVIPGCKQGEQLHRPPIVWARDAVFSHRDNRQHVGRVLGGAETTPQPLSGVVVLKQDNDQALRRYQRLYNTDEGLLPSFSWAIVRAYDERLEQLLGASEQELLISYAGDPQHSGLTYIDAGNILKFAEEADWPNNTLIRDHIVLLGGDYAVQDEHDTPMGWMLGVEVQGQIIQTELQGGGWRPASRFVIAILEILDGLVLVLLFHFYRLRKALLIAIVVAPLLALICSFLTFGSFALWAYYLPILIAVLLHQLYDQGKEYLKHLRERLQGNEQDS